MNESLRVLILGYGEMGHAMEYLLQGKVQLDIWEKYPRNNFQSVLLDDAATKSDIVLFCLPVNPHREIALRIKPLLKKDCLCLSIAKGLDEAGHTAAQIFTEVFGEKQESALMYGPMVSEDIRAGHYAFAQLGCDNASSFNKIKQLFHDTRLYLEHTPDVVGISWSVILKNVYAIAFGIADELKLGDNMRGYLAATALQELNQIVNSMGGQAASPYHLAGLGDLIATATSEDSHHHELGCRLAREETQCTKGEGIHTLEMVQKFNLFDTKRFPLFQLIQDIVQHPHAVDMQIEAYLKRIYY